MLQEGAGRVGPVAVRRAFLLKNFQHGGKPARQLERVVRAVERVPPKRSVRAGWIDDQKILLATVAVAKDLDLVPEIALGVEDQAGGGQLPVGRGEKPVQQGVQDADGLSAAGLPENDGALVEVRPLPLEAAG